jgi:hypothetical protein
MMNVTNKPIMLDVIIPSVVLLNVMAPASGLHVKILSGGKNDTFI